MEKNGLILVLDNFDYLFGKDMLKRQSKYKYHLYCLLDSFVKAIFCLKSSFCFILRSQFLFALQVAIFIPLLGDDINTPTLQNRYKELSQSRPIQQSQMLLTEHFISMFIIHTLYYQRLLRVYMSHCCKASNCDMKCCNENGDCSTSMADCAYTYGATGQGTKDNQQSQCKDWAGILAGSIVGGIVGFIILIIGLYCLVKYCKNRQIETQQQQNDTQNVNTGQQRQERPTEIIEKPKKIVEKQKEIIQVSVVSFKEQVCCICTLELSSAATTKLNCNHTLHKKCLRDWRNKSNKCPMCREQIIGFLQ